MKHVSSSFSQPSSSLFSSSLVRHLAFIQLWLELWLAIFSKYSYFILSFSLLLFSLLFPYPITYYCLTPWLHSLIFYGNQNLHLIKTYVLLLLLICWIIIQYFLLSLLISQNKVSLATWPFSFPHLPIFTCTLSQFCFRLKR